MSKGSSRRASQVSSETVSNNWDAIFGKKKEVSVKENLVSLPQEDIYYDTVVYREIALGDMVRPTKGNYLRSGSCEYFCAVVISIEPFVLCSLEADMRWSFTIKKENFVIAGKVSEATFEKCLKRL